MNKENFEAMTNEEQDAHVEKAIEGIEKNMIRIPLPEKLEYIDVVEYDDGTYGINAHGADPRLAMSEFANRDDAITLAAWFNALLGVRAVNTVPGGSSSAAIFGSRV